MYFDKFFRKLLNRFCYKNTLSNFRYSTWLDEHPDEKDRLQLIQGALESYVASTRARNEKSYAFPCNIMLNILQHARET